ncbi:MAG TPA: amidohydrolase [Planctomycetota bacterium]|nr:amidohydrolase [Planctomycetota bacterium]
MKRLAALALVSFAACQAETVPAPEKPHGVADLIIHHAKIITVDGNFSISEAMAIKDGRIVALGPDEEIFRWVVQGTTRVIDAEGHPILPGLIDSHVHLMGASSSEISAPLPEFKSLEDAYAFIRKRAAELPEKEWIVVPFAFPTRLKEARFPTKAELDAADSKHPVLYHAGPSGVANSKALEVSGITKDTKSPAGGIVVKDPATGEPTGMLRGSPAMALLKEAPPVDRESSPAAKQEALKKLLALYNMAGITSVADRNTSRDDLDHFLALQKEGELTLRITISPSFSPSGSREEIARRLDQMAGGDGRFGPTGKGDDWIRVGPIKLFLDGGMLNGSAYMREPWPKGPGYQVIEDDYHGLLFIQPEQLRVVLEEAAKRGWQMTAHTAGEGAMDVLLDAYSDTDRKTPIREMRWCITHANFPSQRNLEICKRLGVCADVQPAWLYKDGTTLLHMLGEKRVRWFQPYKSWMEYTTIGGGSDHMIRTDSYHSTNPWNPWLGMWITLTRETEGGARPNPEEKLTREQAIRLYTINNAYLHHEEKEKGSLEVGKYADLIIIDRDILSCPVDEILRTKVLGTFVGGQIVFAR